MKFFLTLLIFFISGIIGMKAQLYYFVKSGTELTSGTSIKILYIDGYQSYAVMKKAGEISAKLNSDHLFWKNWMAEKMQCTKKEIYNYDSSLTTNSYDVYKKPWVGQGHLELDYSTYGMPSKYVDGPRLGDYYSAISSDGKTLITWSQKRNSSEVLNRVYWESVDPDKLNQNPYDFLR